MWNTDPKGAGAIGGTTGGDVMLDELKESSPVLIVNNFEIEIT
jgi:hypothetical protein